MAKVIMNRFMQVANIHFFDVVMGTDYVSVERGC
jgi:hypothetical protein